MGFVIPAFGGQIHSSPTLSLEKQSSCLPRNIFSVVCVSCTTCAVLANRKKRRYHNTFLKRKLFQSSGAGDVFYRKGIELK